MKKRTFQKYNTLRIMDCTESGFREIRGYPCSVNHIGKRTKRYRKTLSAMMKANEKRSFKTCFLEALNNFSRYDYCITCTFKPDISDTERVKLIDKMLIRLRRYYKKTDAILRYLMFWGRGDENENLHVHILANRLEEISFNQFKEILSGKQHKINIHINEIGEKRKTINEEGDVIEATIRYLYKHWDTLTDEDKKLTKMNNDHWRPSRTLNKVEMTEEYDDDETEQPVKKSPHKQLNALFKAWCKGSDYFDKKAEKMYKGFRVLRYGYDNGKCPFYIDPYNNVFFRIELAKIGSKIDSFSNRTTIKTNHDNIEHRYVIDKCTGEVIKEYDVTPISRAL